MACGSDGLEPEPASLNFPVGLALTQPACAGAACNLVVVNANFDLRVNAGTVQSYDLQLVDEALRSCNSEEEPCTLADTSAFIVPGGEVRIDSYAVGASASPSGQRVYIPLQSDGHLLFVDVESDGSLRCGQSGDFGRCDDAFRVQDQQANDRDLDPSADPVSVHAGQLAADFPGFESELNYVVVARRQGGLSLFIEGGASSAAMSKPLLVDHLEDLPSSITNIVYSRRSQLLYLTSALTGAISPVAISPTGDPYRALLRTTGQARFRGLDDGRDTRDIVFIEDGERELSYVLTRRPEALVLTDLDAPRDDTNDPLPILGILNVGNGPSRAVAVTLGEPARDYILVSCFDSRDLYVIDVELGSLSAVVRNFRGPFSFALDVPRERLYVADFRASTIAIVDLSPLAERRSPKLLGTLGAARTLKELE